LLDFPELFLGQRHAANENNGEIGFLQGIQAGYLLAFGAFQVDGMNMGETAELLARELGVVLTRFVDFSP
jgi:hypothetical protein